VIDDLTDKYSICRGDEIDFYLLIINVFMFRYKEPSNLDKFLNCIFPTAQSLTCLLGKECCTPDECYDLCPPWTTLTRQVPPPRCLENPVEYFLFNRYK